MKKLVVRPMERKSAAFKTITGPIMGSVDSIANINTVPDLVHHIAANPTLVRVVLSSPHTQLAHDVVNSPNCSVGLGNGLVVFEDKLFASTKYNTICVAQRHSDTGIWRYRVSSSRNVISPVTRQIYQIPYATQRKRTSSLIRTYSLGTQGVHAVNWCWNNGGVTLELHQESAPETCNKICAVGKEMYRRLGMAKDTNASEQAVEDIVLACMFSLKQHAKVLENINLDSYRMLEPSEEKDMQLRRAARKLGAGLNTSGMGA